MSLFYLPHQFVVDGTGAPRSGAKLNFYAAGTLTRQDTYSDSDRTTPNTNPVVADAAGKFGQIYLQDKVYRVILTDSDDVTLYDQDNVNTQKTVFGDVALTKSGNYTLTALDNGAFIRFTATATLTLLSISTAGEGFPIYVFNLSTGVVTIDPGADTINGDSSWKIPPYGSLLLTSDGAEWKGSGDAYGSFTPTFSGFSAAPTGTVYWTRVGGTVHVVCDFQTGTSDDTDFAVTNIPADITPSDFRYSQTIPADDNGSTESAPTQVLINTAGNFVFRKTPFASWTGSGSKGFSVRNATFSYAI